MALFEFLPTEGIKQSVLDLLEIDLEKDDDLFEQKNESFFDKLDVFIMAGVAILILILLVTILRLLSVCCPKVKNCYETIKRKLFYGTFIRYLLLGSLKIQLIIGGALTIGDIISDEE